MAIPFNDLKPLERQLWNMAPWGEKNAMPAGKLCDMLGVETGRTSEVVRRLARNLNLKGWPLCSMDSQGGMKARKGFFRPQTSREIERYCIRLERKVPAIEKRTSALRDSPFYSPNMI